MSVMEHGHLLTPGWSGDGTASERAPGLVTLVGAGPGDPDLLTLKAARRLRSADAVVHDHLVGDGVLALVPRGAERHYAGKERANHALAQHEELVDDDRQQRSQAGADEQRIGVHPGDAL